MDPLTGLDLPLLDVRRDEEDPRVLVVRLDDPGRRNVMGPLMTSSWRTLTAALAPLRPGGDGHEVRAVVLTGAGEAFSAGGDLAWLAEGAGEGGDVAALSARMARYYDDWLSLRALGLPVVAALTGAAVGAGLALALACDVRLVGASARLSLPFAALGLYPGMGTTWTLPRAVGPAAAHELLLSGRTVGAEEAVRLGLATSAHDDFELLGAALGLARTVASRPPGVTRLLLEGSAAAPGDLAEALRREASTQASTLATAEAADLLAAARDRRAPRAAGR